MFRGATAIALKDLRQRFRDRSALVLGFVAPVAMVVLMNSAFSGVTDFSFTLALVDLDGGPVAAGVDEAFESPELAEMVVVERFDDEESARRAVADGDVDSALILPSGLSAMAVGGEPVAIEAISSIDTSLPGEVTVGIAQSFTARLAIARLAAATATESGLGPAEAAALAADVAVVDPAVVAVPAEVGSRRLDGIAYFGPSLGMFFALFGIGFATRGFLLERTTGTLDRIAASPIRPEAILLGKALSVFAYSLASLLVMAAVTGLLLRASWGSPLGVVLLCLGMSVSVVAFAVLVMGLARTERQAEAYSSVLTFALALLGGSFMFLGEAPPLMRRLATLTPNGWALRGFTDLGTGVDTWTAVATPLLAMSGISLLVGLVALVVGRGAVVR